MAAILKRIKKHGCVLMLDFDGVLSPIVKTPSAARMSLSARQTLAVCAKTMPVAIISGRTLVDVEKRVGLKGLIYAGSHGLEWRIHGRVRRKKSSRRTLPAFADARRSLLEYTRLFPKLFIEDKKHSLALGYRSLSKNQIAQFRRGASKIMGAAIRLKTMRVIDNVFTFEIMPVSEWTKGECAQHIFKTVAKKGSVAIYIGDSLTDEDAFRTLTDGITIRVGKSSVSAAQYYFKSRSGVERFLRRIARVKI